MRPSTYLKRFESNPIIKPETGHSWESRQTFNPGVILLEDKLHILYRAIGDDGISRIGYAASKEYFAIDERLDSPVYQHPVTSGTFTIYSYLSGGSFGGAEDPRIVRVDNEDVLYLTYTACDAGLRMALTSIQIKDFLKKDWQWARPVFISPPGQVHKNWIIFPEKIHGNYAILHSLNPELMISYYGSLDVKPGNYLNSYIRSSTISNGSSWDSMIRGAGAPPVKTEKGWLLFSHAMTKNDFGKYKVGAMLLDLENPSHIICRSTYPVLEPSAVYEENGFKPGVVYLTGVAVRNGILLAYYGASDSYVCVASCRLDEIVEDLLQREIRKFPKQVITINRRQNITGSWENVNKKIRR
jgi:beta-1,2-mannobiose phosphorylase / 1,2-beta-oligomannan phosphorylase